MRKGVSRAICTLLVFSLAATMSPRYSAAQDQPAPPTEQPQQCLLDQLAEIVRDALFSLDSLFGWLFGDIPAEVSPAPGDGLQPGTAGGSTVPMAGFPSYAEATEDFEGSVGPAVFNNVACQGYAFSNLVDEATRNSRSFQYASDQVRLGEQALQFEIRDGDGVAQGDDADKERCELLCLQPGLSDPGSDSVYGFSIYIPQEFPNPTDFNYITQFLRDHNSPNAHANPTYGLFVSPTGKLRAWFRETVNPAPAGRWEEYDLIKGRWVDYELRIAWRADATGRCEIYQDGALLHIWTGQNLFPGNAATHWKIGMYRGHNTQASAWATYDRAYFARRWPVPGASRIVFDAVSDALTAPIDAVQEGLN